MLLNLNDKEKAPKIIFLVGWFWPSLYNPGCPATHYVDQACLDHKDPPASA